MNVAKRARPKLRKAQMAEGGEFYYLRKPSSRLADYSQKSEAPAEVAVTVQTKKK